MNERISRLQAGMSQRGIDLLALGTTVNMRYALGFAPLVDERPCFLLLAPDANALLVPAFNADQVEAHTGMSAIRWADAGGRRPPLKQALASLDIGPGGVLAADDIMRADAALLLQEMASPLALTFPPFLPADWP